MPSLSRAVDALSFISKQIWRVPAPSGAKPVSKELGHYRQLERRLWMTRWRRAGRESADEDAILDEMENIWLNLIEDERGLAAVAEQLNDWFRSIVHSTGERLFSIVPELKGHTVTPSCWMS